MELELNDEEAAVLGDALECLISHPATDDDTREVAIDLAHHLLALAAGHFDDAMYLETCIALESPRGLMFLLQHHSPIRA